MSIIVALLVLSVLIFFHELGHFSAARLFGVKVEVFSIGFGKKLLSKTIGDTQWSISAIPLGGYVKMKGQDDTDPSNISLDNDSYNSKKPWQRIIILLAGPFANFMMAFFLYFAISNMGVPKLLANIDVVKKDTPAFSAGLQKGDTILQINGYKVEYWGDLGELISKSHGQITTLVLRDEELLTIQITPKVMSTKNMFGEDIDKKIIGIYPSGASTSVVYGLVDGVTYAWEETKKASTLIVTSIEKLLSGEVSTDKLGGVITIVDVTAKASSSGIISLLFFTALISINLGVLNLLPIPALDGGHIMFNIYEMITGRSPNEKVMIYITIIGWILLLSLMLLGLYNDINRLIG